ncbi:MAG TPA: sigma-70 family RNA polymerase sigma factor [Solirubrobacteraceae bacterium]
MSAAGRAASPGDNELIARMQQGSTAAFGVLCDRYGDRAYRVARAASFDRSRAEEAVQEAFSVIWTERATYRPDRPTAAAWLMTVVRNRAIDAMRRDSAFEARRAGEELLERHASSDDVAVEVLDRIEACELRVLVGRLPQAQRDVIVLAFYSHLSHTEIASLLDVPLGTIKARGRRGLHALRGALDRDQSQPELLPVPAPRHVQRAATGSTAWQMRIAGPGPGRRSSRREGPAQM